MKTFAETAHSEIQQLIAYYNNLSALQKNYFFPRQLKHALESYTTYENNGAAVYVALSNANWFLKHRPFFSFLSQFSTSDQNPVAQSFRLAHELHGLNDNNEPTKFNNIQHDIKQLIQYKNNWFAKLFFPTDLSNALDNFKKNKDLLPLCKALANNTNTWFFPTLNLFGKIPLMQAYRQFEADLGKWVAASDKSDVFKLIADSVSPLEQLEAITNYYKLVDNHADLNLMNVYLKRLEEYPPLTFTRELFRNSNDEIIDHNTLQARLERLKKYPTLNQKIFQNLNETLSEETISALLELGDNQKMHKATQGLNRLPETLSNEPIYVNAVIHHAQPDRAAITLNVLHENKLLDTEKDKALCLEFLKKNQSPQSKNGDDPILSGLCIGLSKPSLTAQLTPEDKRSTIEHSKALFDPLTILLWRLVPDDLVYKSHQDLLTICKTNASDELVTKIIQYFLTIPAVFNDTNVQLSPKYDKYTKPQIDDLLSTSKDPELLYSALPHLIRRNTQEANAIIMDLLNNPVIGEKVSKLNVEKRNIINNGQLSSEQILSCARAHNGTVHKIITDMRLNSGWVNNTNTLFSNTDNNHMPEASPNQNVNLTGNGSN